MAIPNNLSIAQLTVKGTIHKQDYRNIIHFATDTVGFDADPIVMLNNLNSDFAEVFVANLLPSLSNEFSYIGVASKRILPALSDEAEELTGAGPGLSNNPALPSHNRMTVFKRSGKGGRKGKGNIHLPPPIAAHNDEGELTDAGKLVLTNWIAALTPVLIGAAGSSQWHMGVLEKVYNVPPGQPNRQVIDHFWHETKLLALDKVIGRSGRRRIGRGS